MGKESPKRSDLNKYLEDGKQIEDLMTIKKRKPQHRIHAGDLHSMKKMCLPCAFLTRSVCRNPGRKDSSCSIFI